MVMKKIIRYKNKAYRILLALSLVFGLQVTSCKKQQSEPQPEIRDYYDPYTPVPKSKFDSVKTAQTLLAQTIGNDSLEIVTEKTTEDERNRK